MPVPIFVSSDSSPYFAQNFSHCTSFALRLNFDARRTRLCPEDDSIITILNNANHLPDYMASKFRRLQCELYRRTFFIMNTTKSINSTFVFEPAIPGFTLSNNLIGLKNTGNIKKICRDMVLCEMYVCIELVMFCLRICIT